MSLADAFAAGPPRRSVLCRAGRIRAELDPAAQTAFDQALHPDSGWATTDIARVLAGFGHHVSDNVLGKHRRGGCCCESG